MDSPFKADVLRGKVVFITGGATGIGFGICKVLGSHGAKIGIMARRKDVLDKAVEELSTQGISALAVQGDVRDPASIEKAIAQTVEKFGPLNILVNNAAGNFMCSAEELSTNGFATVMGIDLQGTFNVCKAAFPYLKASAQDNKHQNGALIINITATLQYKATPFQVHAASAKAGIDVITQTLAVEWGDHGIRVVGIAPGPIEGTVGGPGGRVFGIKGDSGFIPSDPNAVKMVVPLARYGTTDDIGYTALFLATKGGSYISGTTVVVDGGQWHGSSMMYHGLKGVITAKKDKEKEDKKAAAKL